MRHLIGLAMLTTSQVRSTGTPDSYTFSGVDENDDTKVRVFPKPSGVFSLRFDVCSREPNLTADADCYSTTINAYYTPSCSFTC